MPLEAIDDPRLLYEPPDYGEPAVPEPKAAKKRKPATKKRPSVRALRRGPADDAALQVSGPLIIAIMRRARGQKWRK